MQSQIYIEQKKTRWHEEMFSDFDKHRSNIYKCYQKF